MPDYYHHLSEKEVLTKLKTSTQGLSEEEAAKRLRQYGLNELKLDRKVHLVKIILAQFSSPLVSIFLKENTNILVLGFIIIANVFFGFFQEYKAEKAIEALQKMTSLQSKVL